jgi:hypothetical protein
MKLTPDKKAKNLAYYQENKALVRQRAKEWKKANPEKVRLSNRKTWVKSTYGITWDAYLDLYNKAEGRCEVCGLFLELLEKGKGTPTGVCVDHDHETGKVRGILCRSCNVALGHFKDDTVKVLKAYEYLLKHK